MEVLGVEEPGEDIVGLRPYMSLSGTGLSPLFEPLSYDSDFYARTLENLNIPYSFGTPNPGPSFPEFDGHPSDPTDKDEKLPSPNALSCACTVRDSEGQDVWVSTKAQLNGSFFFADVENTIGPPAQLTCYRRNIFGVSGCISFPRTPRRIADANGDEMAISGAEVCVSAFESTQGRATELVHVPLRAIGSDIQVIEENFLIIPLFSETTREKDQNSSSSCITFPFEWKRLQFRKATANNGGRRGIQQQFHIRISLLVTLETGVTTTVATIESGPVVVRGRNPGHFIHEQANASDATLSLQQSNAYQPRNETLNASQSPASMSTSFKKLVNSVLNPLDSGFTIHDYDPTGPTTLDIDETNNWLDFDQEQQNIHSLNTIAPFKRSSPTSLSPAYSYPTTSSRISNQPQTMRAHHLSAQYSTVDFGHLPTSAGITSTPHHTFQRPLARSVPPVRVEGRADTTESSDPLYEYFPLGLNGWTPPVDAVYRPHVAHNTVLVPELKGLMIK